MKRMNFPGRKEQRRAEGAKRQAAHEKLDHAQKIQKCLDRPGHSRRELTRLGFY